MEICIGIDARYGFRDNRRGIGNYIYKLVEGFKEIRPSGFVFHLYVDKMANPIMVKEMQDDSFKVHMLHSENLALWEQIALPMAAKRNRIDILHCTSNIAPVFLRTCKYITTIHDTIEFRRSEFGDNNLTYRHHLSRFYRMGILPRIARMSDLIITVSEYSKCDISAVLKVSPEKIRVTYEAPNYVNENSLNSKTLCAKLNIPENFIFALGAVDQRKNTKRLLEAYKILRNEGITKIPLVVAGIENLEFFSKYQGEGVYLFEYLSDKEIAALYRYALFFVYPSLYEGFGLPVLEAMLYGSPVLCSETTSVGEVAVDAAFKFNPADVIDMAGKMKILIYNSELRAELRKKGQIHVAEFSWEKCTMETLEIYKELLGGQV